MQQNQPQYVDDGTNQQLTDFSDNQFIPVPDMPSELTKWQLDSTDIIDQQKHYLRGEIFDTEKSSYVFTGIRLMNEKGVSSLSLVLQQYLNKNTNLSNLSEDFIRDDMVYFNLDLVEFIRVNYTGFEINKEYMSMIIQTVCDTVFFAMMRAMNNGERIFLRSTEQRKHIIQELPEQKKKGFWIFGKG
jgi:hypothetical protein